MFALKRFLAGILIGSVLFTFAGCGSSEEAASSGKASSEPKGNVSADNKGTENKGSDKSATASGGDLSKVQIVTEDYKPFNYKDTDGTVKGLSTDKVKTAISKLGTNIPINVYPWKRAYEMAKSEENVLIYSMGKTAEREKMFKWIAPVADINVYLYTLSDSDIKLSKLEDAKKYKIATMAEDFTEQGLKKAGFKDQLVSSPKQEQSIRQLFGKKAELWIATAEGDTLKKMCDAEGLDSSKLKVALTVEDLKTQLWIAASNKTSDDVVKKFKDAMGAK